MTDLVMARRNVWACLALICLASPADCEIVLSDLIVELQPGQIIRKDIELWNNSNERTFVEIAPAEITSPGRPEETRVSEPNPERLGLLVSPNRLILEPGQHKVIRIAAIARMGEAERVYRVTVKPVVGEVRGEHSGLKLLVGYDVLVLVRPTNPAPKITGVREGRVLIVRNEGNSSAELLEGKQCASVSRVCEALPGKRIYAGAEWRQTLGSDGPVEYRIKYGRVMSTQRF